MLQASKKWCDLKIKDGVPVSFETPLAPHLMRDQDERELIHGVKRVDPELVISGFDPGSG